jgi:prepilin-type N-terminal cleavage/methylation domain-containing protein
MKSRNSKIKLLNHLLPAQQKGFTLLELLVALLAVTLFVAFSLEGMVLASLAQIRAREKGEASLIIQRNLEEIREVATTYGITPPLDSTELEARCSGTGGDAEDEGLAAGLYAVINNPDTNLDVEDPVELKSSTRSYPFQRTITLTNDNKNVLQIEYEITDPKNSEIPPLAQLYTEVVPDVALQCPSSPSPSPSP